MTSMTFHLHLANHANKKGLFPVMLRMTQNRKSKRLRTLVEVRTAEWNKNKECVRASNPNSEWMNEVLEKELRMAKDVYLNLRNRGMDTPEKVKDSMKRGKRSPSFMVYAKERFAKMAKEKGLDNLEVKALMAHSNLATTQKYMGELDTKQNDDALSRVFRNKKDEP